MDFSSVWNVKMWQLSIEEMPSSVSLGPNLGLNYAQIEPSNSRGSSLGSGDSSSLESRPEINPVQSSGISDRVEEELSQLWDSGQEWILIFDNLLKHPGGKASKGCKCDICQRSKNDDTYSKSQYIVYSFIQKICKKYFWYIAIFILSLLL